MFEDSRRTIRESMLEGLYYPEDQTELRAAIERASRGFPDGMGHVVVSPYSSYEQASVPMASAWKFLARKNVRRVLIVAPCETEQDYGLFLPESSSFQTPLGNCALDHEALSLIHNSSTLFECNDLPHLREQGIELQIPFCQFFFPDVPLIPILVGSSSESLVRALHSAIFSLGPAEETAVVFSCNLCSAKTLEALESKTHAIVATLGERDSGLSKVVSIAGPVPAPLLATAKILAPDASFKILARTAGYSIELQDEEYFSFTALGGSPR